MHTTYLRNTTLLLVMAYIMITATISLLFHPLLDVSESLAFKHTPISASTHEWVTVTTGIISILLSLAAVIRALRGLRHDKSRRAIWIFILVIGVCFLLQATGVSLAGPKFYELFKLLNH